MNKYAFPKITNAAFRMNMLPDALISEVLTEYHASTKENLLGYAIDRKVLPFVAYLMYYTLKQDCDFWLPMVEKYTARNRNIVRELDKVFDITTHNGVKRLFVVQNFGALLAGGRDISLFASSDVDLCGNISEKEAIDDAFRQLGYLSKNRFCGAKLVSVEYSNEDLLPGQFVIGVEYDTLSRLKLPSPIEAESFVEWNHMCNYLGTSIVLPPIESLLYICLVHISLHSFSREPDIRLYIDIENCLNADPDWQKVLFYAERDSTLIRILTAAQITKGLFDVELPQMVCEKITENSNKISKLLKLVYDRSRNELIYEPGKMETLVIETRYYDHGNGLWKILFPDKEWLNGIYCLNNSNKVLMYLAHWRNLFS